MKIVVWAVYLSIAGTGSWGRTKCYEDHCNEKRCQICEDLKRHCNPDYTSSKCDGFCKALEVIGNKTQSRDPNVELPSEADKRRMWKLQNDLAKARREFEIVRDSLNDAKKSITRLIDENNYLRNIISDPKEMLFYEPNGQTQERSCDCRVQDDSLSRCWTQLKEQSSRTDVLIGNVIGVCRHELLLLLAVAFLIIYLMCTSKPSSNQTNQTG